MKALVIWLLQLNKSLVHLLNIEHNIHCKEMEVDLTSQLQSGFIQVQVVVHLLLQGSLSSEGF